MKKEKKAKEYKIKVPVFATEKVTGNFSYEDAISKLEKQLEIYSNDLNTPRIAFNRSNKTQKKVIHKIETERFYIGEENDRIPILLLKVTTYLTNLLDGYTEEADGTIRLFDTKTKLGSEQNYIVFYPNFVGITPNTQANWLVFSYIDTNKVDSEMTNTTKLIISSVLNLKHIQITREDILSKIKKAKVPFFHVRYVGIEKDIEDVNDNYLQYLFESKIKKDKSEIYKDLPFELAQQIIAEEYALDEYQIKEVKLIYGNSEYKLIKKVSKVIAEEYNEFDVLVQEARNIFEEAAEHTFIDHFVLFEDETKMMYDKNYIIEKITPIITNYIASYVV